MNTKIPKSFQNLELSMTVVMITTLLIRYWGMFSFAPTVIKLLFSLSVWFALFLFPWSWIKNNDFSRLGKILINLMLLWGLFEIFRSLLGPSVSSNGVGNKYITLFFNEYCALLFIPPLYVYTVGKYNILHLIFKITQKFIRGGIIVSIISWSLSSIAFISEYLIAFWEYVNNKNRVIIILVYIAALFNAILGARVWFIFFVYSFIAYCLCYRWQLKRLQKIACISSIFLPLIFFMPLFYSSAQSEESYFKTILGYVTELVGGDSEFKSDTRTFLYLEMANDLTESDAWIIGKGAESSYYSSYFSKIQDGDSSIRLTVEVPLLLFMLRGGLVYTLIYLSFFLLCIYRAVWIGKSRFLNCIGIMLAGWFANLFVGDVSGCNIIHLILFSLCGLTLSEKWLKMTDPDIKKLINRKVIIRI